MEFLRQMTAGAVGKVGWLVPFFVLYAGWRTLRDPEHNGPVGRQVIGWAAFALGVLGIVHIANGNPQPELGDASQLQQAGGAVGFVMSSLLLDLLRTAYVVVPVLALLAFFGVLIITATPVYQIPAKLAATRDKLLGRTPPTAEEAAEDATKPMRTRRRSMLDEIDPEMGDPAYDSPVLSERELKKRRKKLDADTDAASGVDLGIDLFADAPTEVTPVGRGCDRRAGAAAAHAAAAAGRAARAVRRHHLHPAGQRGPQAGLGAQGPFQGQ